MYIVLDDSAVGSYFFHLGFDCAHFRDLHLGAAVWTAVRLSENENGPVKRDEIYMILPENGFENENGKVDDDVFALLGAG